MTHGKYFSKEVGTPWLQLSILNMDVKWSQCIHLIKSDKKYIARNIHLLGSTEVAISLVPNINQSTPSSLDLNSQSELTECSITIIGNFQLMKDNSDVDMPYSELLHTICRHIPELTAPFIRPVIWMYITLLSQYKLNFYAESSKI